LLKACRELGVAVVAYSPLGRGFLAGKFKKFEDLAPDDWRRNIPRFQGENFQKNLQLVEEIERIAKKKGATAAQLCLAWILAQGKEELTIKKCNEKKTFWNLSNFFVVVRWIRRKKAPPPPHPRLSDIAGDDFFVIPGTTSAKNLDENIGALSLTLTPEDLAEVRKVMDSFEVAGKRWNESYMARVNI
jgi:aryl-alcohol dehydrogenase-like predicted oxidoreductase